MTPPAHSDPDPVFGLDPVKPAPQWAPELALRQAAARDGIVLMTGKVVHRNRRCQYVAELSDHQVIWAHGVFLEPCQRCLVLARREVATAQEWIAGA